MVTLALRSAGSAARLRRRPGWLLLSGFVALAALGFALTVGQGADFDDYAAFFSSLRDAGWSAAQDSRFEPLFSVLALSLTRSLGDVAAFSTLAAVALAVKLRVLERMAVSRSVFALLAIVYCARFVPLHEMTQLRIALALALVLVAATARTRWLWLVTSAAAVVTHYSTVIVVPIAALARYAAMHPEHYRAIEFRLWAVLLAFAVSLSIGVDTLLEPLTGTLAIIDLYSTVGFGDDEVNLLSVAVLMDGSFLVAALLWSHRSSAYVRLWLFVQVIGLAMFVCLRDFPVLAHRTREMVGVFWLFYLATAFADKARGQRLVAACFCAANVVLYTYLNFFSRHALVHL